MEWESKESFTKFVKEYVKSVTDKTPSNFTGRLFEARDFYGYNKGTDNRLHSDILHWGTKFYRTTEGIHGAIFCTLLANEFQKNLNPNCLVISHHYDTPYRSDEMQSQICVINVLQIMASL